MAEQFYTILTQIGKAKIANASALGNKVNFTHFALGDGDGSYYNPVESQTELKNEVWRGQIGSVTVDEGNPNWLVIETIIPANIGGFMIREAGVFDEEGNLLAIGKYPETYKPAVEYGSAKDLYVRMILEVANTSVVNLKVDPTVILATKKDIDILTNRIAKNEIDISTLQKEVSEHKADYIHHAGYGTASGTNAKTITLDPIPSGYKEGMTIAFKNITQNTGAVTINVNGLGAKSILKSNGSELPSGFLKGGSIYTIRYNGSNFILQGEGGEYGTAQTQDVLSGKTIGTEEGIKTGTMPNNGSINKTLTTQGGQIAIPKGYTEGGVVKAYFNNLMSNNIRDKVNIGGVIGTLTADINYYYDPRVSFVAHSDGIRVVTRNISMSGIPVKCVIINTTKSLGEEVGTEIATLPIPWSGKITDVLIKTDEDYRVGLTGIEIISTGIKLTFSAQFIGTGYSVSSSFTYGIATATI